MKSVLTGVSLILILLLPGCTLPVDRRDGTVDVRQIEELLARDEYSQALDSLPALPDDHKDFAVREKQRKRVLALARAYERRQLAQARTYRRQNKWAEAINVLHEAEKKYRESKNIETTKKTFLVERADYIDKLESEANISRAMCLLNELPWRKKRANIDPDDRTAQWELTHLRKQISQATDRLITCGRRSLASDDLILARKCLQQARKMHPGKNDLAYIDSLEQKLASKKKQHSLKRQRAATVQKEAAHMKSSFHQLVRKHDFILAREQLDQINTLVPDDEDIPKLEKIYQAELDTEVRNIINSGSVLYRQEKIQLARRTWETALEIDPGNKEVMELIDRANRVLSKLREIRSKTQ
jgi:tetratricopeptide (TPR) repeat protein